MNKGIEVIVDKEGTVEIEAVGYSGAACEQATKFLEEALGSITAIEWTKDYFETVENKQEERL